MEDITDVSSCIVLNYSNVGWTVGYFVLVVQVANGHPRLTSNTEFDECINRARNDGTVSC